MLELILCKRLDESFITLNDFREIIQKKTFGKNTTR